MKSPFPGLDPYLQRFWSNVHTRMMAYIGDQMQERLPPGLWTAVEESVTIDDLTDDEHTRRNVFPDVHVAEEPARPTDWRAEAEGGVAVAEPLVIPAERLTERHLEIVDTSSGARVVTVIEVLSPANHADMGRRNYWRKQRDYLRARVNLVEIDLLRGGGHTVAAPSADLPGGSRAGCVISVFRAAATEFEVYPITLRQRLPRFRVPLRVTDKDVPLDVQAVLDQCYANGRYDLRIDYAQPPDPPLAEADREWAAALLAERAASR